MAKLVENIRERKNMNFRKRSSMMRVSRILRREIRRQRHKKERGRCRETLH